MQAAGRGGLVAYVTAGDPDRRRSAEILVAVARGRRRRLEVGVPFSDPLADGPVIQRATERALAAGMTLRGSLELVRGCRRSLDTPIVLFTYANPVLRMGAGGSRQRARGRRRRRRPDPRLPGRGGRAAPRAAGRRRARPDLPAQSDDDRCADPAVGELGRGFLYVISRLGVTGARDTLAADVAALLARVRAATCAADRPGLRDLAPGARRPRPAAHADAAVVGSALVQEIATHCQWRRICRAA